MTSLEYAGMSSSPGLHSPSGCHRTAGHHHSHHNSERQEPGPLPYPSPCRLSTAITGCSVSQAPNYHLHHFDFIHKEEILDFWTNLLALSVNCTHFPGAGLASACEPPTFKSGLWLCRVTRCLSPRSDGGTALCWPSPDNRALCKPAGRILGSPGAFFSQLPLHLLATRG